MSCSTCGPAPRRLARILGLSARIRRNFASCGLSTMLRTSRSSSSMALRAAIGCPELSACSLSEKCCNHTDAPSSPSASRSSLLSSGPASAMGAAACRGSSTAGAAAAAAALTVSSTSIGAASDAAAVLTTGSNGAGSGATAAASGAAASAPAAAGSTSIMLLTGSAAVGAVGSSASITALHFSYSSSAPIAFSAARNGQSSGLWT
mmetsp:Transcript_21601/g.39994  ORF Transcript_21601/g.39994 Transcript_21601/m.39994 type:complete len:206 (+) Transcript_21601:243-860(+)